MLLLTKKNRKDLPSLYANEEKENRSYGDCQVFHTGLKLDVVRHRI